jgi:hypothetical protein
MRVVGTISGPSTDRPDPELLESLNRLLPEKDRKDYGFSILRVADLNLIDEAIRLSESRGWRRHVATEKVARGDLVYFLDFEREYDASDYAAAEYLGFAVGPEVESPGRDAQGRVQVDMIHSTIYEHQLISGGENGCDMLVADPVRHSLERAGLKDVSFRETVFVDVRDVKKLRLPWDYWKQPWWEIIGGELVLPPLSPRQTIQNLFTREAVPRGYEPPCLPIDVDDPRIGTAELHYERSDLRVVEPFDWAKTHEKIGFDRNIIVSQRFYQAVKAGGDIGRWIPVRIHD